MPWDVRCMRMPPFAGKPELERKLLPALVNKFGDPEKKVRSLSTAHDLVIRDTPISWQACVPMRFASPVYYAWRCRLGGVLT